MAIFAALSTVVLLFQTTSLKALAQLSFHTAPESSQLEDSSEIFKADRTSQTLPDPALVAVLRDMLKDNFDDSNGRPPFQQLPYYFTQYDLNSDGVPETIVTYTKGLQCSNRSCPIHIFERQDETYQLIGESWVQRGMSVAVLEGSSRGWYDLAAPLFSYEDRDLHWQVAQFNGSQYELTQLVIQNLPSDDAIILDVDKSQAFYLEK